MRLVHGAERPDIVPTCQRSGLQQLVGRPPGHVDHLLTEVKPIPQAPESIMVGIPAELVRRRSDIRAKEQQIIAQNARIGAAMGDWYPRFTLDGTIEWRERKIGAYAKRERGMSALPSEWSTRTLPEPIVVSAFAAIFDKEGFQELCQTMRRLLGVGGVSSALGDGAKWVWNVHAAVHGKMEECLDVYHAAEHISDCSKVLFGESSSKTEWFDRGCVQGTSKNQFSIFIF